MKRRCLEQVSLSSAHLLFHGPTFKSIVCGWLFFSASSFCFPTAAFLPLFTLLFFLPSVQVFFILRCLCCLPPLFGSFQFQHSLAVHCVLALFDGFDSVTYLVADRWEPFWGSIMKCTSRGMWPRKKNGNKYQIPNPSVTYI